MTEVVINEYWLGLQPYVLITFRTGDEARSEDPNHLYAKVNAGGGIATYGEVRAALEMALENLSGDNDARLGS